LKLRTKTNHSQLLIKVTIEILKTNFPYLRRRFLSQILQADNDINPNSRDLVQVIKITLNFSIILINLRGTLFSTVPTNIDDKNLRKT